MSELIPHIKMSLGNIIENIHTGDTFEVTMVEMVNYQWDEENNVSKQHRVCELLNQRTGNISRVNEEYYKHYELVTWELIKEEEE